jgi:hypothetical protein
VKFSMAFVYHGVPAGMVGDAIYPLSRLERVAPEVYEFHRGKYRGREAVLDARITDDGLLFNDTVHCAPLHPYRLYAARAEMGFEPSPATDLPPLTPRMTGFFFEIPLERIVDHRTLWYRWKTPWVNGYPHEDVALTPPLDEFEPFEPDRYRELPDIPDAHRAYLQRMKEQGRPALQFVHIPHVLIQGPIDTRGLRKIAWETPPDHRPAMRRLFELASSCHRRSRARPRTPCR